MIKKKNKKMLIKHLGALLALVVIVGDLFLVISSYQSEKLSSEISERHYHEYMEIYSGQLTPEKEAEILAEQLRIVDAKNLRSDIELNLLRGKYTSESEYISEYENAASIVERKEAFDALFKQYSYVLDVPEKRFLTLGDYSGLAQDFPDVFLLFAVVFITAALFLGEEQSNVITLIRISPGGRQKTLFGKLTAILVFTVICHFFRVLTELSAIVLAGNPAELAYPVQSIEFFANCPYDISILQAFIAISALRLLGYFFIEALVIFLATAVRKSLPTIFLPCAVCVLQQFAFDPATPAYYIPTGFLRAVGYFRGTVYQTNSIGENIAVFTEIPLSYFVFLIVITIIFIAVSLIAAYLYYVCKSFKFPAKKVYAVIALFIIGCTFSGCATEPEAQTQDVVFNLWDNSFFAQNTTDYFISDEKGIAQTSKTNGTKTYLPQNEFDSERQRKLITLCGNTIYYNNFLDGVDITALSLDDFGECETNSFFGKNSRGGFLGIKTKFNRKLLDLNLITGFFTNGSSLFAVSDTSVYQITNGSPVCVIDGDIYNSMLCFDGRRIYYIDGLLRLNYYDLSCGEKVRFGGEIVNAIYYDGSRLLYSDKTGIFSVDTENFNCTKLSSKTADSISSDGKNVVYSNNEALYLLSDDEIVLTENAPVQYAMVSGMNKVLIYNDSKNTYELIEILLFDK